MHEYVSIPLFILNVHVRHINKNSDSLLTCIQRSV